MQPGGLLHWLPNGRSASRRRRALGVRRVDAAPQQSAALLFEQPAAPPGDLIRMAFEQLTRRSTRRPPADQQAAKPADRSQDFCGRTRFC